MPYDPDNIFAQIIRGEIPAVKVYEDEATLAFMDVMPQAAGHTLAIPKEAAQDLFDLSEAGACAVMKTVRMLAPAVRNGMEADGLRIFQLNGAAAGQTVFHYHVHLLPCYRGETASRHATTMQDAAVLEKHAEKIRAALQAK